MAGFGFQESHPLIESAGPLIPIRAPWQGFSSVDSKRIIRLGIDTYCELTWPDSTTSSMLVTTTQLVRRTMVAATCLVPTLLANSALSWTFTSPAKSPPISSSRIPLHVSEYKTYRLKLSPFVPSPARTRGVLLTAHINRGPALSLLLDSGARDRVLKER